MAHQLRVLLQPRESVVSTKAPRLFDGAIVNLQFLGKPASLQSGEGQKPAKLSFIGKFFRSVRQEDGSETRLLATVDGQLERLTSGDVKFVGATDPDKKGLWEDRSRQFLLMNGGIFMGKKLDIGTVSWFAFGPQSRRRS